MVDGATTYVAIVRLHASYADIVTRNAWEEMATIVAPDAHFTFDVGMGEPVDLADLEALVEFGRRATADFAFYSYQPVNTVLLDTTPTSATGRFYAVEHAVSRSTGDWLEFHGRYDDQYVLRSGRWMFAARRFHVAARRVNGRPEEGAG